jgi:hypothetical protein
MDLVAIVAVKLITEDCPSIADVVDALQSASPHDPVLHPAIGALDLAFGLGREGMEDFHAQDLHHALPPHRSWGLQLGIGLISLEDVLTPDAVASLDEAEDTQGVDIVAQEDAIGLHEDLGCQDVVPGCLHGEEVGEEEHTAEVVDGGDQGPFLLGVGGPKVEGGVMLDEGPDGGGHNLPCMGQGLAAAGQVAVQGLGPANDGGDGNRHAFLREAIPQGSVVVARDRQSGSSISFFSRRSSRWMRASVDDESLGGTERP